MAIEKAEAIDEIVIKSPYNHLVLRTATLLQEDGVNLASRYSREKVKCGALDSSDNLVDTDMSGYSAEVQGVAAAVWTDAVKASWKAALIAAKG